MYVVFLSDNLLASQKGTPRILGQDLGLVETMLALAIFLNLLERCHEPDGAGKQYVQKHRLRDISHLGDPSPIYKFNIMAYGFNNFAKTFYELKTMESATSQRKVKTAVEKTHKNLEKKLE